MMFTLKLSVALLVFCAVLTASQGRRSQRRDTRPPVSPPRTGWGTPLPAPAHFCPYGGGLGDEMSQNDDGNSGLLPIPPRFTFFGKRYNSLYVNTNGLISFRNPISTYTPEWFPLRNNIVIAPYWADADTNVNDGRVFYRATTAKPCLDKLSGIVNNAFKNNFKASWLFIATWHRVTFYGGSFTTPMNTFQAILVANRRESYVVFNYGDMAWTTGTESDGDQNGLGGIPAEVGFNAGDRWRYYTQFGSLTPDIIDIRTKTNCGLRGRYVFRVDGREILSPVPKMWTHFRTTSSRGRSLSRGKAKVGAPTVSAL